MQEVAPHYLHAVAGFATNAGALLLANGAAAAEVVDAMLAVAQTAKIEDVTVDVTYAELTFAYRPAGDAPYLQFQTIQQRTFNYGKLTDVSRLVERFSQGQVTIDEAAAEVSRIAAGHGPYPWWLTRLAAGFAGGNAALIFGGGWIVALAAFLANILLDYLLSVLARHNWLTFYLQVLAGFIAVVAAAVVHFIAPGVDSSRMVVSVIIVMFAGMTSTGGVQDAITGWYLTALGRIFEAVMNTIGLIVGIAFGMLLAERLSIKLTIEANVSMGALQLPVMLVAAAFVALGFSFVAQSPRRILLPTAILSALGYAVDSAASAAQLGAIWSSAAAAFVIGIIAVVYTQWFKAPAAAFAICAILPMVPGMMLYQGLSAMSQPYTSGLSSLVGALGTALALAGGVTFGEYLAIVSWRQLRLVENRFFAPLFAGPFATQGRKVGSRKAEKVASD